MNKTQTQGRDPRRRRRDAESKEVSRERELEKRVLDWVPKTELGRKVKDGEIDSLEYIYAHGLRVMEPEIVDKLMPNQMEKMVELKKTARVIRAGRMFSYRATALIGNGNGFVGIGIGSDKERVPAMQKAARKAKLAMIHVHRGSGSWEEVGEVAHSIPFVMHGKCGSVRLRLMPAPKGVGLVVGEHLKDVMRFAGISDVWSQTTGRSKTTLNFVKAALDAFEYGNKMRQSKEIERKLSRVKTGDESQ